MSKKVLLASAEAFPIAKVGGLGDVAYSLPKALNSLGADVRVIMPQHKEIGKKTWEGEISLGSEKVMAEVYEEKIDSITFYLVKDSEGKFFGEGKPVYGLNDEERYVFFSKAILEFSLDYEWRPEVLHLNDWHTALTAVLAKRRGGPKTVFTIHNLGYQGELDPKYFEKIGFEDEGLLHNGKINLMKGAIMYSDGITTVSPTYAKEIQTEEYGFGLHEVLRENSHKLRGILNGIDYDVWNPEQDKHIYQNYSPERLDLKERNKEKLMSEEGISGEGPLIGIVSRLAQQKGIDVFLKGIEPIFKEKKACLIVLGTGEREIEEKVRELERKYKGIVKAEIKYSEELAHKIYAGADIFAVPSRYEPCGLTQMIAMHYGTVPIVRNTGGLADTVISPEESREGARGFKVYSMDPKEFEEKTRKAIEIYEKEKEYWRKLQLNGMKADFSWRKSAREYLEFYSSL